MSDPTKRVCPFCAEVIRLEAKICPRCRQWLTLKSFRHPFVMMFTHLVPLLILWIAISIEAVAFFDRFQNPKPYYSEFPDAIKILNSKMNWAQTQNGLQIFITGVLTNGGPVGWKEVEIDCRFFDTNGVMVDAANGRCYCTVLPNDDTAFRVAVNPTAPTNSYAGFKVSVCSARNLSSLF